MLTKIRTAALLGGIALLATGAGARAYRSSPRTHTTDSKTKADKAAQQNGMADPTDVIAPRGKVMTWGDADDTDGKVKNGKPTGKGWVSLFDGKTLKGWVAEPGYWQVVDGAIVGDKKGSTPHHHYMFSAKDYADFECHIDVKMTGYNSGVCARIHPKDFDDVPGYQVDMAEGYWGCLWDEHHRQKKIVDYPQAEADKIVHKDAWNHYYFTMHGPHVVMYLNGVKTADVQDPEGYASGPLGFQLCHGDNTVASFRNIYVKLLAPALPSTAPALPATVVP